MRGFKFEMFREAAVKCACFIDVISPYTRSPTFIGAKTMPGSGWSVPLIRDHSCVNLGAGVGTG